MNSEDYETLPTSSFYTNMGAGAIAGIVEHCVFYPLDSAKTRMQSMAAGTNNSYIAVLKQMKKEHGFLGPWRGMKVVVSGAGPAHAFYFPMYEFLRDRISRKTNLCPTLSSGAAGTVATLLHDAIMVPTDVVKQRLQMHNSPYKTMVGCALTIYRQETLRAFYLSYPTQLFISLPMGFIFFIAYPKCQSILNKDGVYNPTAHAISGGIAGGIGAAVTTPLDVCKTLLNTQQGQMRISGFNAAFWGVYEQRGIFGWFRGLQARVFTQAAASALCWCTYETLKFFIFEGSMWTLVPSVFSRSNDKSLSTADERVSHRSDGCIRTKMNDYDDTNNIVNSNNSNSYGSSIQRSNIYTESTTARSLTSMPASKPCELPVSSPHHGVYNALSLSTLHTDEKMSSR